MFLGILSKRFQKTWSFTLKTPVLSGKHGFPVRSFDFLPVHPRDFEKI